VVKKEREAKFLRTSVKKEADKTDIKRKNK
jgi:hypothetical protein